MFLYYFLCRFDDKDAFAVASMFYLGSKGRVAAACLFGAPLEYNWSSFTWLSLAGDSLCCSATSHWSFFPTAATITRLI